MEPLSLTTVTVDHGGVIAAVDCAPNGVTLDPELIGKPWAATFADWALPPVEPDNPRLYPCRVLCATPHGVALSVEMIRLSAQGTPCILAIFRSANTQLIPPRMQQLSSVGEVACGACHEINNALTIICGWLEVLRGDFGPGTPHQPTIDLLRAESARLAELTRNLQEVARGDRNPPSELNLKGLIEDVTSLVTHDMKKNRIRFQTKVESDLPGIMGNGGQLKQALLNLLVNARHATPPGGWITVSANKSDAHVAVQVQDTGCGIAPELHARVFHTFFTTKPDGTGLGLPITKRIVESHGGTIHLDSEPGRGSRFTIRLPVRSES